MPLRVVETNTSVKTPWNLLVPVLLTCIVQSGKVIVGRSLSANAEPVLLNLRPVELVPCGGHKSEVVNMV